MSIAIIEGEVVEGRRLGRQLGFPTANILLKEDLAEVADGVYSSCVEVEGAKYRAVTNIGSNPTVGAESRRAESYILDFEGDIYGCRLVVELCEYLREERKFESIEALREQIAEDIKNLSFG